MTHKTDNLQDSRWTRYIYETVSWVN